MKYIKDNMFKSVYEDNKTMIIKKGREAFPSEVAVKRILESPIDIINPPVFGAKAWKAMIKEAKAFVETEYMEWSKRDG